MSILVLQQHDDAARLAEQFTRFERRLAALPAQQQRQLLLSMHSLLASRDSSAFNHYLVYWPLDRNYVKRCLCEHTADAFSLVSITTLAQRMWQRRSQLLEQQHYSSLEALQTEELHQQELVLDECTCHDHSRKARPLWQEFVYPQQVRQLCQSYNLLGPSPDNNKRRREDTAEEPITKHQRYNLSRRCSTDAYHYHFSFDINVQPQLAPDVTQAFTSPSPTSPFTAASVQQLRPMHQQLALSPSQYKARFKTATTCCVRAQQIRGGSLKLADTPDAAQQPYTLFVTNCWLEVPRKENRHAGAKHYTFHTTNEENVTLHTGNHTNRVEVGARGCLINSASRLIIHFKQDAQLLLMTTGRAHFQLQHALLDLWCNEPASNCNTPYRYKVDHEAIQESRWFARFLNSDTDEQEAEALCERAHRHHEAYRHLLWPEESSDGAVPDITLSEDGKQCLFLAQYRRAHQCTAFSQYGSYRETYYADGTFGRAMDSVAKIGIYFRKPQDEVPEFYTSEGQRLSYRCEEFTLDGQRYRVRLLYHHRTPQQYLASFELSHRHRLLLLVPFTLNRMAPLVTTCVSSISLG